VHRDFLITLYKRQEQYTESGKLQLETMAYWENNIKRILVKRGATMRDEQDLSGL
jgi:hypothetical protein